MKHAEGAPLVTLCAILFSFRHSSCVIQTFLCSRAAKPKGDRDFLLMEGVKISNCNFQDPRKDRVRFLPLTLCGDGLQPGDLQKSGQERVRAPFRPGEREWGQRFGFAFSLPASRNLSKWTALGSLPSFLMRLWSTLTRK